MSVEREMASASHDFHEEARRLKYLRRSVQNGDTKVKDLTPAQREALGYDEPECHNPLDHCHG
jgi:hypothetical protein